MKLFTAPLVKNITLNHYLKVFLYYWAILILLALCISIYSGRLTVLLGVIVFWMMSATIGIASIYRDYAALETRLTFSLFLGIALSLVVCGHYFRANGSGQLLALLGLLLWTATGFVSLGLMY